MSLLIHVCCRPLTHPSSSASLPKEKDEWWEGENHTNWVLESRHGLTSTKYRRITAFPDLLAVSLSTWLALFTVTALLVHVQPGTSTALAPFPQDATQLVSSRLVLSQVQDSALALAELGKVSVGLGLAFCNTSLA